MFLEESKGGKVPDQTVTKTVPAKKKNKGVQRARISTGIGVALAQVGWENNDHFCGCLGAGKAWGCPGALQGTLGETQLGGVEKSPRGKKGGTDKTTMVSLIVQKGLAVGRCGLCRIGGQPLGEQVGSQGSGGPQSGVKEAEK